MSLIGLYIFALSLTARNAINLSRTNTLKNATALPAGNFVSALETERVLALVYLSRPTGANLAALENAENRTGATAATMRTALTSGATTGNASTGEKKAITVLLGDAAGLPALHSQIRAQIVTRDRALADYNVLISDSFTLLEQVVLQETNMNVGTQSLAVLRVGRSEDLLGQEDALVLSDLAAGKFPAADRQQFTQLAGARRVSYGQNLGDLSPQYRALFTRNISPQALAALSTLENTLMGDTATNRPPAVSPLAWLQAAGGVTAGITKATTQASNEITAQARGDSRNTYLVLLLAGGIGLAAVVLSILVSIWVGRGLIRELAALRDSARELATKRLPDVVRRLAAGQHVDVPADAPALPSSSVEIAQVEEAFSAVQRTAVEAAVGQARLRQGISDIFRNLARRSQSLLHRQLTLLDGMERRTNDPDELEDLFRIDHLTTRMRRHAESLIILSGDAPARGWRRPVPFVDVLRAAVAEVEDYTRIKVTADTGAALSGPAVADVIHMIAELAENAVTFSPPNTPVLLSGDVVGRGFAVEIEDRGLGLSEEQRAEINELLSNPPQFDLSGSDQLGLFVASQLARKHNIQISLRTSPYGGTTAIVLIPSTLVVPEESFRQLGTEPATEWPMQLTGRHAAREDAGSFGSWAEPAATAGTSARQWAEDTGADVWAGAGGSGPNGYPAPGSELWAPAAERVPADTRHLEEALYAETRYRDTAQPDGLAHSGLGNGLAAQDDGPAEPDLDELSSLPRRVRQASLAPQLRETGYPAMPRTDSSAGPPAGELDELEQRSPDQARSTITAIQRGWERGRSLFDPPDKSPGPLPSSGPFPDLAEPSPTGRIETDLVPDEPATTRAAEEPAPGQPAAGQPAASQPAAGQPAASQPAPGQPAPGQPAAGQPTGPVADPGGTEPDEDAAGPSTG
ncbi:MAG: nitrate- and nitrite sensing domain-containing protein [Streptosporangiaceae bacterium]